MFIHRCIYNPFGSNTCIKKNINNNNNNNNNNNKTNNLTKGEFESHMVNLSWNTFKTELQVL